MNHLHLINLAGFFCFKNTIHPRPWVKILIKINLPNTRQNFSLCWYRSGLNLHCRKYTCNLLMFDFRARATRLASETLRTSCDERRRTTTSSVTRWRTRSSDWGRRSMISWWSTVISWTLRSSSIPRSRLTANSWSLRRPGEIMSSFYHTMLCRARYSYSMSSIHL